MKKKQQEQKVELLAPAGEIEQFYAACENGADAVYFGGTKYNARMNAPNFTMDTIKKLVAYAHPRGIKLYTTVNVLLYDDELEEALIYCSQLYETGIDGLIIQDLGLASLIQETMSDFPLHLSTQGTVYNISGAKAAKELGFCRVVPARELSIKDVSRLVNESGCEIEVFCHGALCICYSGQCQLSRAIGGRSANRGTCAQPCRLAYTDEKGNTGHFLSPKDLSTIEILPELLDAGVHSLKIEGRMKSPEYTAIVTSVYRKYIDRYYRLKADLKCTDNAMKKVYSVADEDKQALEQIFSRSGFSQGYFHGLPKEPFITGDIPKHSGIYAGCVVERGNSGLLDIKTKMDISIGDVLEIRSKKATAIRVTYLKNKGKDILQVGDTKGRINTGVPVYKLHDSKQLQAARKSYEMTGKRSQGVEMHFYGHLGKPARLEVRCGDYSAVVETEMPVEKAEKKATAQKTVIEQLKKTGTSGYHLETFKVLLDQDVFVAVSQINKLRRDALAALATKMSRGRNISEHRKAIAEVCKNIRKNTVHRMKTQLENAEENIKTLYALPPITYGKIDSYLESNLHELPDKVLVENLGWIQELVSSGRTVYGGAGLNVMNYRAKSAVESLGAAVISFSPEIAEEPERLMITEYPLQEGYITDRKGQKYVIARDTVSGKTEITKKGKKLAKRR